MRSVIVARKLRQTSGEIERDRATINTSFKSVVCADLVTSSFKLVRSHANRFFMSATLYHSNPMLSQDLL
jgi:hypothetical protein